MSKTTNILLLLSIANYILSLSNNTGFPRKPGPNFKGKAVLGTKFVDVQLSDYQGKWLVLLFYPFDFTYVCPTELIAFSDSIDQFKALNTEVLGISVDSHFTHLAWSKMKRTEGGLGGVQFPLFADISKDFARNYGV